MAIPERAPGLSGTSRDGFEASHAWSSAGPQKRRRPSLCSRPRTGVGPADRPAETPADCVSFLGADLESCGSGAPTAPQRIELWTTRGLEADLRPGVRSEHDVSLPMEELKEES
jgi:hypothetical protein